MKEKTVQEMLRDICLQLMSDGISEKAYDMLIEWLQCMGEMELLLEIVGIKMKVTRREAK